MKKALLFLFSIFVLSACSPKEEPIDYGQSQCDFCKMTIVDRIHGGELVTKKGKVHVYDAVECMLNDLNDRPQTEVAMFLVNHYETPTELIDAKQATYLVSENLPSPMGGFLTAFSSETEAEKAQDEYGGKLYDWDGINQAYKN